MKRTHHKHQLLLIRNIKSTALVLALGAATSVGAAPLYDIDSLTTDDQAFLATQGFEPAAFVDPNLINPWGMSFSPTGPFWVSNQGSNTSTLYNGAGEPQPLVVSIPATSGPPAGPTGQAFNGTGGFVLPSGGPGLFFFANLDGSISAWNPGLGTSAQIVVPPGSAARPAIYTGLTIASHGGGNFLYAANNLTGAVDVFDTNFAPVSIPGGFVDPNAGGLAPFNVRNIDGLIYVTYATPGPNSDEAPFGTGFVSVFNPDGSFIRRFATGGQITSPWGITLAPDDFGDFSNALLIGNFHENFGFINAFDPTTGAFLGSLRDKFGNPIEIPYLWALMFGNGGTDGDPDDLYFTAGIGDEEHGLFGEIAPVPEPAMTSLLALGVLGLAALRRRGRLPR